MELLRMDCRAALEFAGMEAAEDCLRKRAPFFAAALEGRPPYPRDALGWYRVADWTGEEVLSRVEARAAQVREQADVFVLVGVGGSNNGARAAVKAFGRESPVRTLYAGNSLSATAAARLLRRLEGRSVHINVIAKNFETLEPGLAFRLLRDWLGKTYGPREAARRITVTGSRGGALERMAGEQGWCFLPFPEEMGGRYSVLSPVGLFPMAVSGVDIRALVRGGREMEAALKSAPAQRNEAVRYAVLRHLLHRWGFAMESLTFFEPDLEWFARWWVQLFAESEGKENTGLYPIACSCSEDLHSVGQYFQHGRHNLFELFLRVAAPAVDLAVPGDGGVPDGFGYLDGRTLAEVNDVALRATLRAHREGGVPCSVLELPACTPYYFGQLFYFFQFTCMLSCGLNGVNPFDQPGVEDYKREMFKALGR